MNSRVPSGKSESVRFKSFKLFLTLITYSQSFLVEVSLSSDHLLLLKWWYNSSFSAQISAPTCCKILHTVSSRTLCRSQLDMPIISAPFLPEYSAFLQHWHLRKDTFFNRKSFTFFQTWISDSSPLKLAFKFLIWSVNLDIVLWVCFCILRNKSIIEAWSKIRKFLLCKHQSSLQSTLFNYDNVFYPDQRCYPNTSGQELNFENFELNFWYQVQFCAMLAALFSKTEVIFKNRSHTYSLRCGTFIEKQRNGIHRHKVNE